MVIFHGELLSNQMVSNKNTMEVHDMSRKASKVVSESISIYFNGDIRRFLQGFLQLLGVPPMTIEEPSSWMQVMQLLAYPLVKKPTTNHGGL